MILKAICRDCNREMKTHDIGIIVLELDGYNEPYKLWHADVVRCPLCAHHVVTRFADKPISQQGIDGFDSMVAEAQIYCRF